MRRSGNSIPRDVQFALLLAAAIVSLWINGGLLYGAGALNKDFGIFYASSRAFLQGQDMYGAPATPILNLNPPHLHLLLLPLVLVSPVVAWSIWVTVGLVCLLVSLLVVARELNLAVTPWRVWVVGVALLGAAPTHAVVATGQVAWLLALPMTLLWRSARNGRWILAGSLLGLLVSVKPFLLVLAVYPVLRRQTRALFAACGTAAACFVLGMGVFGIESYFAWLHQLQSISWSFLPLNASVFGLFTRTLSVTDPITTSSTQRFTPLLDAPGLVRPLWIGASALIGTVTMLAIRGNTAPRHVDRGFALLLTASLLISPLGWIYYVWLLIGPVTAALPQWWHKSDVRRTMMTCALGGLFWPIPATMWLQPHAWATLSLGSIYFWTVFAAWIALILDL